MKMTNKLQKSLILKASCVVVVATMGTSCGKTKKSDAANNPPSSDQVEVKTISWGEHIKFSGATTPAGNLPLAMQESHVEKFSVELPKELDLKLEDYMTASACDENVNVAGPFVSVQKADGTVVSNDALAAPTLAVTDGQFGRGSGKILITVTAYSAGHCDGVEKEFAFVETSSQNSGPQQQKKPVTDKTPVTPPAPETPAPVLLQALVGSWESIQEQSGFKVHEILTLNANGSGTERVAMNDEAMLDAEIAAAVNSVASPAQLTMTFGAIRTDQTTDKFQSGDKFNCIYELTTATILKIECAEKNQSAPTAFTGDAELYTKKN